MIKKGLIQVVLIVIAAILLSCVPVWAAAGLSVYVNGQALPADAEPITVNGRVMVPLRVVAEKLNAKVYWFADDERIEVKKGFKSIELWVTKEPFTRDYAIINGEYQELDAVPEVVEGRTYVPLRIIGEGLGAKVEWDSLTKTVVIQLAEPEELAGVSASVRDSVYNTMNVKSLKLKGEGQLRLPEYPQLNIFKFDGEFDRQGNMHLKGHMAGWFGEALYFDEQVYFKSVLFNDQWVGLRELLGEGQVEEIEREKADAEAQFKDLAYDYITELVRALGTPVVGSDEKINGIVCKKITFVPDVKNEKGFNDLRSVWGDVNHVTLTVWIGKDDQLVHKSDLRVDFANTGNETAIENGGFIQVISEFSDIDQYFIVGRP